MTAAHLGRASGFQVIQTVSKRMCPKSAAQEYQPSIAPTAPAVQSTSTSGNEQRLNASCHRYWLHLPVSSGTCSRMPDVANPATRRFCRCSRGSRLDVPGSFPKPSRSGSEFMVPFEKENSFPFVGSVPDFPLVGGISRAPSHTIKRLSLWSPGSPPGSNRCGGHNSRPYWYRKQGPN